MLLGVPEKHKGALWVEDLSLSWPVDWPQWAGPEQVCFVPHRLYQVMCLTQMRGECSAGVRAGAGGRPGLCEPQHWGRPSR